MKLIRILIVSGAIAAFTLPVADASPARFWFSSSNIDPNEIEAPQIDAVQNSVRYLYIWGQPPTVNQLQPYNADTNRFETINSFSLNLVTNVPADGSDPILDFIDGTFQVYDPVLENSKHRFQFIYDSDTVSGALTSTNEPKDRIIGMQGFEIAAAASNGFGHPTNQPGCNSVDPFCALVHPVGQTPNSAVHPPAWLIGSVGIKSTASTGHSYLHMQIGYNGMNYQNPAVQVPAVTFGLDGTQYNSSNTSHRETTLAGDTVDATITARATSEVQLSTWTGSSGVWTAATWNNGVPQSSLKDARLPSSATSYVVTVAGKQLANKTTVESGARLQIAAAGSLASTVTVAAGGSVSGQGWLGGDLALDAGAIVAVDSPQPDQPFMVVGSASIAGAVLRLGSNFNGSGSPTPIEILRAYGGIHNLFATSAGSNLGGGLFVGAITHSANSVFLQISGVAGDYNRNGTVDAADYVAWRQSTGCDIAVNACLNVDGDHDGTVDTDDYGVWRAHFGQTAAGSGASIGVPAPEPPTTILLLTGLLSALQRRREPAA